MYAGESITFETNLTAPVYTVSGNASNLIGLNVTFENGNITISTVLNYKPDNFTMIFFDEVTREVIIEVPIHHYSGGGTITKYVDRNVTVYIPEYINTTEILEVEKIVDKTETIETGYKLWEVLLVMVGGIIAGGLIIIKFRNTKKRKERSKDE